VVRWVASHSVGGKKWTPVLCHQPLDYLTRLVICARVGTPAKTMKFEAFSDRWVVTLGQTFGIVLDPGIYIKKVWSLTIPEGMKEVLWKEMNGAQVLGHRYFGQGRAKSDLGRICSCGSEVTLGHILVGCAAYRLQPLMATLMATLDALHPVSSFKTMSPDSWGTSPWYPLLALKELEETAYPIVKGRKKILKDLKKSRQWREWLIGNYYWALWKWRMKEIHEMDFTFVPVNCVASLLDTLSTPIPAHLVTAEMEDDKEPGVIPSSTFIPQSSDLARLPPPISHLLGQGASRRLSSKGRSILCAIQAPITSGHSHHLSRREAILRALTDDAYA